MSHPLRPRAAQIYITAQRTRRSISTTLSRPFSNTETKKERTEDVSPNFLSTRLEIDAYLRAQNDANLLKVKKNLESLSQTASSINTLLPLLANRASHIRSPQSPSSTGIPPYIVTQWRKSSENIPPITKSLMQKIERVVQNIEDLQSEPYRADVTPSEREKVVQRVGKLTREEKEKEMLDAEFRSTGMEARFLRGVAGLEESVKSMLDARAEKFQQNEAAKVRRIETAPAIIGEVNLLDGPTGIMGKVVDNFSGAVSYIPPGVVVGSSDATRMEIPKTAGWGVGATKVEERGKGPARTANPFAMKRKIAPSTSSSSATNKTKGDLEALRRKLDGDASAAATPQAKNTSKIKADVPTAMLDTLSAAPPSAQSKSDPPLQEEAKPEPKIISLADRQRRMNALLGAEGA